MVWKPAACEDGLGLRADAPERADFEGREEGGLRARRDDDEAVRLARIRGDLGDELVGGDADGEREAGALPDFFLEVAPERLGASKRSICSVASRKASSSDIGSTSGVTSRKMAITSWETSL